MALWSRSTVFRRIHKPCAVLTALAAALVAYNLWAPAAWVRLTLAPTAHTLLGVDMSQSLRAQQGLGSEVLCHTAWYCCGACPSYASSALHAACDAGSAISLVLVFRTNASYARFQVTTLV